MKTTNNTRLSLLLGALLVAIFAAVPMAQAQYQVTTPSFFSFDNGFTTDYSGGLFTITAIPEPSTYVAAAGLLALVAWPMRRRLLRDAKSILGLRPPMRDRLSRKA
jgi:hypothetical protein